MFTACSFLPILFVRIIRLSEYDLCKCRCLPQKKSSRPFFPRTFILHNANRNQDENYFIAWRIGGVSVLCCFATDVQVDGKLFSDQISQVEHRNLMRRRSFTNSDKLFFSGKFHPSAFPFGIVQKYQGKIKNIRGAAALSKLGLGVLSPLPLLHIHLLLGYRTTGSFTHPLPSTLNRDRLKIFLGCVNSPPQLRQQITQPRKSNLADLRATE